MYELENGKRKFKLYSTSTLLFKLSITKKNVWNEADVSYNAIGKLLTYEYSKLLHRK